MHVQLLHLIVESWVSTTAAIISLVAAMGSVLVIMAGQDPVAWSIAIAAIITSLSAAMVSVIVALKTSNKIAQSVALQTDTNTKVSDVAVAVPEIHTAVNSNYQKMQEQLDLALGKLDAAVAELKDSKAADLQEQKDRVARLETVLSEEHEL